MDTFGSTFDTVLAVYAGGTLAGLTAVAGNDDTSTGVQSQVRFTATTGTTYRIAVAGFNGTSGRIELNWRLIAPCDGQPVTVALAFGDTPTAGPDVIRGTPTADTINAGGGIDRVCAEGGNDTINGGQGNDRIFADGGNDTVRGGAGNDLLVGGLGADRVFGDGGNDTLNGQTGADLLQGGTGRDRLNGGPQRDNCNGGPQRDTHSSCEVRTSIP
jgi:Ca2+-binding RTX toxin-like protein